MQETADMELLRQYVHRNSEEAFAALVTRHVNLVYSAALRKTGNAHAAEEITQAVFILLARKADRLRDGTILSGWLYQTARLTSASFRRTEVRRVQREQEAYVQSLANETEPELWTQIGPLLDDAMGQLGDKDRNAVVLRFFEGKSFSEIGTAFGASENAAKKRVAYALEKLRKFFAKRGVTVGTSGLAVVITANAIQAVPVGLAAKISAAAVLAGTTLTATTAIVMTTLQKTIIGATLAAAVGTGIYEARQASTLRNEVQTLHQQQAPLAEQIEQLQSAYEKATNQLGSLTNKSATMESHEAELLRLRAEVTRLRNEKKELGDLDKHVAKILARTVHSASTNRSSRTNVYFPSELRSAGLEKLDDAIQTCLYALSTADPDTVARVAKRESAGFEGQDLKFFQYTKSFLTNVSQFRVTSEEDFPDGSVWLSCDLQAANGDKRSFRLLDLKMHPIDGLWVLDQASPITMIPPDDLAK